MAMILAGRRGLDTATVNALNDAKLAEYRASMLSLGPIAYWELTDPVGSATAEDQVNSPAQDGTHVDITIAEKDGHPRPYYDGTSSYTDILSAGLVAAFDGSAGTLLVWARAANSSLWTDGNNHYIVRLYADDDNWLGIYVPGAVNNRLGWVYRANAVQEDVTMDGMFDVNWMFLALTWDAVEDEVKAYIYGEQEGLTQTVLGVWAGALTVALISAYSLVPNHLWHGYVAHAAVFDYALSEAEILALSA